MQVIIVGDDQPLRVQLARTLGAGRFDVICAVPHAEQVPQFPVRSHLLALVAHRSALTTRSEVLRLHERFDPHITLIAVTNQADLATAQLLVDGLVDDVIPWAHGQAFLNARLDALAQAARRPGAGGGGGASAFLTAVAPVGQRVTADLGTPRTVRGVDPLFESLRPLFGARADGAEAADAGNRDHLFVWDLGTGEVGWPLEADPEALGLPTTRAAWDARVHGDDVPPREVAFDQHLATRTPYGVMTRLRFESALGRSWRSMLERGHASPAVQGSRTVVGLLTDIDAEVRVEVERQIDRRRGIVSDIAGTLADELGASLMGAFTNLDQAIAASPQGRVRSDLDLARQSLQGAFEWTKRLLALGRRAPLQPEYVSLQDVVHDMVDRLARQLGGHIQLVVEARESPGVVLADPMQLETVLTTLCERAARAMPHGGRVTVTLAPSNLRDEVGVLPLRASEGRWARLRVTDEGPPLAPEMLEGRFDPMAHGLGDDLRMAIALAVVRAIVVQHDGFIRGIAPADGGAAFEVFLPTVTRPPARLRRPESGITAPVGGGELVLVCDDDELVLRMIEKLLKSAGYQVITATDGEQGVALVAQHKGALKLCLFDIVMPIMGGRVASERVRQIDPTLPCVFMSGYTMSIQDTEFVQEPSRHFIPKPFNAGQLLREVRVAIERR
ncbi:MAG: response regulator [Deltaproteobacteria bacterium]|nr:response regulator [Deltaproteobacteria bacterium]